MEESDLLVVVVKASCKYQRPAKYDDLLTVKTRITRITSAKIVFRDEEQLAHAQVTLAVVNREGAVQPVPEWMAAIVAQPID